MGEDEDGRYAVLLGERLRRVRQQQGLSLHDVEERSTGELKASVVGAYERGERAVSITRLHRMADFYRVPVVELLPDPAHDRQREAHEFEVEPEVVIDLAAFERSGEAEPAMRRYLEGIQARRGDYNGKVLTIRAADLETLAAVLDSTPDQLRTRMRASGLLR